MDQQLLQGPETGHWDRLGPSAPSDPALFSVDDATEHLRADVEDARQVAAVAASAEASRLGLLLAAESSGALVAAEMTHAGMPWSVEVHERLLADLLGPRPPRGARPVGARTRWSPRCATRSTRRGSTPTPGPSSSRRSGAPASRSPTSGRRRSARSTTPASPLLLRYKSLSAPVLDQRLGLDRPVGQRRPVPSVVPTGRLDHGPVVVQRGGALSIPTQVRPAAVADDGWTFVVADVAQLEPRVLAGMSGDRALARSARGVDLYQGMVDDGAVATRKDAKLGLLGAMYGATSGESGRMLGGLAKRYPQAFALVEDAARAGERGEVVRTLLGRGSPGLGEVWDRDPDDGPADPDGQARFRRAYGRFTRNFVVQGTGAEWALCWIADLRNRLWRLGATGSLVERPHLVFFVHDEVVVHTPIGLADAVAEQAREAAVTAAALVFREIQIDFPLTISIATSYADAGSGQTRKR